MWCLCLLQLIQTKSRCFPLYIHASSSLYKVLFLTNTAKPNHRCSIEPPSFLLLRLLLVSLKVYSCESVASFKYFYKINYNITLNF